MHIAAAALQLLVESSVRIGCVQQLWRRVYTAAAHNTKKLETSNSTATRATKEIK